jgi:pimeloyl-ACP methyl ester carboxylesterase
VVPDRPGYGLSTYLPSRTLIGWVSDVTQLLDDLGLERFAVLGVSGGGPYALACARALPQRVTAVGVVSGVAPLAAPGSEAGMLPSDRVLVRLARCSPALIRPICSATAALARRWPERVLDRLADELAGADATLLRRPDIRAAFVADLVAPVATTGAATAQDYGLLAHDWGFDLKDIDVPVHIWHGGVDREVPLAQAREQARVIPNAVLHECPDEGHLLVASRLEEILRVLVGLEDCVPFGPGLVSGGSRDGSRS